MGKLSLKKDNWPRFWGSYLFWGFWSLIFYPIHTFGRKKIPKEGPIILASNHLSYLDPLIIGIAARRPLSYVAKESLFKNKIVGKIISDNGGFPIKRSFADIGAIKECLRRLKAGKALVIYPEGTRKAHQKERKILPGIGLLTSKSMATVIPVFMTGADKVLPPGKKFPRRARVDVYFGDPVRYSIEEDYQTISNRILHAIYALEPRNKS